MLLAGTAHALAFQSDERQQVMSLSQDWQGVETVHARDLRWTWDERRDLEDKILLQLREEGFDVSRIHRELRSDSKGAGLRPTEAKRLSELQLWLRIQQWGYVGTLVRENGIERLDLSPEELTELDRAATIARRELRVACQSLEQSVLEQLAGELGRDQQRYLLAQYQESSSWSEYFPLSPCRLREQLGHSPNVKRLNSEAGIKAVDDLDRHLRGFGSQRGLLLTPEQLIFSADAQRCLGLTTRQINDLQSIQEKRDRRILDLHIEMLLQREKGASKLFLGLEELELEAITRESANQLMEEVLLPEQRIRLTQLSAWARAQNIGWLPMLTDGSLGERLHVSTEQRMRLFRIAKQLQQEVEEKHVEMIQAYQKRLLEAFQKGKRDRILSALGELPTPNLLPDPKTILEIGDMVHGREFGKLNFESGGMDRSSTSTER